MTKVTKSVHCRLNSMLEGGSLLNARGAEKVSPRRRLARGAESLSRQGRQRDRRAIQASAARDFQCSLGIRDPREPSQASSAPAQVGDQACKLVSDTTIDAIVKQKQLTSSVIPLMSILKIHLDNPRPPSCYEPRPSDTACAGKGTSVCPMPMAAVKT